MQWKCLIGYDIDNILNYQTEFFDSALQNNTTSSLRFVILTFHDPIMSINIEYHSNISTLKTLVFK